MNSPVTPRPAPAASPTRRRSSATLLSAVIGATVVFLGFAAYGRFAPATYVATAQIVLKPTDGKPLVLGGQGAPAERLRDAALDSESLAAVAAKLRLGTGTSGEQAARRELAGRLEVHASGAGSFDVSVRESTAASSQEVCNLLAHHAASQATRLFGETSTDEGSVREAARTKAAAALADFIAKHPEIAPNPVVAPVTKEQSDQVAIPALRAERDQIQAKLDRLPSPTATSDNPFGERPPSGEITRMRRRIAEIDQTIASRKRAEHKADQGVKLAPDVDAEWKRLLKEVEHPTLPDKASDAPSFTVLLREATLPTTPVVPDRHRLALFGAIASVLAGGVLALVVGRRRKTSASPARPTSEPQPQPPEPQPAELAFGATEIAPLPALPMLTAGDSPRPGSDPPRAGSDPPRTNGSDPPRTNGGAPPVNVIGRTVSVGSDPPRAGSDPPRTGSDPPHAGSDPPRAGSDPPREAQAIEARATSSNPPEQPAVAASPAPSPVPPADAASAVAATVAVARVPKGTQIGLGGIDPRALVAAAEAKDSAGSKEQPFDPAPSARGTSGPTLRPPPPDQPAPEVDLRGPSINPHALARASARPAEPVETDDTWTGPSRAHRRSMPARRTTQVMGSPIPPVRRGSSEPAPLSPRPNQRPSATGYSYVSERPEGRPPATPPYYFEPKQSRDSAPPGRGPAPRTPRPPSMAEAQAPERARVLAQPVRAGWAPDPSVNPESRRTLADQIFPLAVERCFVLGVIAMPDARLHKSRIAAELAFALSEPQEPRVLLMEGDFQWPAVQQLMGIDMPMSRGLSQQLRARSQNPREPWTVIECAPTLHVLAEGIMRSPAAILTMQFESGMRNLRSYYDIIVLDGPDTASRAECGALGAVVDGVVCVVPGGSSPDLGEAAAAFANARFTAAVGV